MKKLLVLVIVLLISMPFSTADNQTNITNKTVGNEDIISRYFSRIININDDFMVKKTQKISSKSGLYDTDVYYKLENEAEADNGTSLTLHNSPTFAAGKLNKAIWTASGGGYARIYDYEPTYTNAMTMNFWMNPIVQGGQVLGVGSSNDIQATIGISADGILQARSTHAGYEMYSTTPLSTSTWYMVTVRMTGTEAILYINGLQEDSDTTTNDISAITGIITLASYWDGSSGTFTGGIDDFSLSPFDRGEAWIFKRWNNGSGSEVPPIIGCKDNDGDGFNQSGVDCGVPDCDDSNPDIYPSATETCNYLDDNCNNETDENFPNLTNPCEVGIGECKAFGIIVCSEDGSTTECNATAGIPSVELCDGLDNDCDNQIDENYPDLGEECWEGIGACNSSGVKVCTADKFNTECNATPGTPIEEVCNGIDDDCDGFVDEDELGEPLSRECYTGPLETRGIGECSDGIQFCINASYGACEGDVIPITELCNGLDDDCNGENDNGFTNEDCSFVCIANDFNWTNNGGNLNCCGNDPNEDDPYEEIETSCHDDSDNDCDGYIDLLDDNCKGYNLTDRVRILEEKVQNLTLQLNEHEARITENRNLIDDLIAAYESTIGKTIEMIQDWNLVISPFPTRKLAKQATSSIDGCYESILTYDAGVWFRYSPSNIGDNLKWIYPDKGYWVKVNCSEATWTTS